MSNQREFGEIVVDLSHVGNIVLHRHVSGFLQKLSHPLFLILEGFLEENSEGYFLNVPRAVCYGFVAVERCGVVEVGQCTSG